MSGAGSDGVSVSVMEGDSVTLNTDVKINQQEKIHWYFNDIRIAYINGYLSDICTDVQCKERFRDRLKLDNQTGSLTIMNITNTDSGEYKLLIIKGSDSETIFNVTVHGESCLKAGYLCLNHIIVFIISVTFRAVFLFSCIIQQNRITYMNKDISTINLIFSNYAYNYAY